MDQLESRLKQHARNLGFDMIGIAPATPADGFERLRSWLERGFAGEMAYMSRRPEARRHPDSVLPDVKSVIMVAMNYKPPDESATPSAIGKVARYARGPDYHEVLRERLNTLFAWLQTEAPNCRGRGVVDTAPLLERDFARRAGLGWFGKNTMLLNKKLGSYFLLGALLVDQELTADAVHETAHCGTCTACLDACPTQAFPAPGELDSRRCISYLTIELRTEIPTEFRTALNNWVFGCDICQEVCPWNRKAPTARDPIWSARPDLIALDPVALLELTAEEFRTRFRGTALMRTKRSGLLRNAALILGNRGDPSALPSLHRALDDPESLVREAAQWAIEQIARSAKVTD
jgi:epoxyqueuosine reductase